MLSERLKSAMDEAGVSQAELARACGVKPPSIHGWLSGKSKFLRGENLLSAARRLGVEQQWLATGVGPRHSNEVILTESLTTGQTYSESSHYRDVIHITQYDAGGAMGQSLILQGDQPGIIRHMAVTQEWAQKNLKAHTGLQNLCIVTGFGDSMKPLYNPGDPLIIDQGIRQCDQDAVYFFRVGNEGFIKRLQRIPGQGIWVLSANKEYKDWLISKDSDFEVFGRVMKAWKGEDL